MTPTIQENEQKSTESRPEPYKAQQTGYNLDVPTYTSWM